MNWQTPLIISLGAIPGALSRYYISVYFAQSVGTTFPLGTLVVNVTGAFLMGWFTTYSLERAIVAPDLKLLVTVGFLGAYTTFSTYALDVVNLRQSSGGLSFTYWLGSPILGVVGLELGSLLAKKLP